MQFLQLKQAPPKTLPFSKGLTALLFLSLDPWGTPRLSFAVGIVSAPLNLFRLGSDPEGALRMSKLLHSSGPDENAAPRRGFFAFAADFWCLCLAIHFPCGPPLSSDRAIPRTTPGAQTLGRFAVFFLHHLFLGAVVKWIVIDCACGAGSR